MQDSTKEGVAECWQEEDGELDVYKAQIYLCTKLLLSPFQIMSVICQTFVQLSKTHIQNLTTICQRKLSQSIKSIVMQ